MSAQPEQAPAPPAPAAAAQLLAQLRADRRADTWVPAFERDWAKALEDSRHSYSLTPLHDVVRTWQLRAAAARPSTPTWTPAGTSPASWTWTTSSAPAGERSVVDGAPVPAGGKGAHRTSRARQGDGPRHPRHRRAFPVGLAPVERRGPGRRGRPCRLHRAAVRRLRDQPPHPESVRPGCWLEAACEHASTDPGDAVGGPSIFDCGLLRTI